MSKAPSPEAKRRAAGLKVAAALDNACKAMNEFIRARVECADDPRAGQPNDGCVKLRDDMRELCGYLETVL